VFLVVAIVLSSGVIAAGCGEFRERMAVGLFYREAPLARGRVYRDLSYWAGSSEDPRKHRLDLYVPDGSGWPIMIFAHGGGWRKGDKAFEFGGADPYGNIGRFYAARGIGVAVVNYRLQPAVTWREQVADIAQALGWVFWNADTYGADKRAIFVSGHSSGAQLSARAALDRKALQKLRLPPRVPCGVIAVSGAPFDISDDESYALGTDPVFYEKHFRAGDNGEGWKYEASAVNFVTPSAPQFLLLHGRWEPRGLKRQNEVMFQALRAAGVLSQLVVTPWDSHFLIVAALSYPDSAASSAIIDFVRKTKCF
jgi:acetyl esterase/lipase